MKRRKARKKRFRKKIAFVMMFFFIAAIGIFIIDKGVNKPQNKDNILLLVNRNNALKKGYEPANLVKVSKYVSPGITEEEKLLNKEVVRAYVNMCDEAHNEGLNIYLVSGYRSYETQKNIYDYRVKANGKKNTDKYTAKPGCSEHQTGLALDVTNKTGINSSSKTMAFPSLPLCIPSVQKPLYLFVSKI